MNYFNYFTEIEEHFQQARGSGFFLLSPLDWAMIETWKESGVPLDAVHKGIERAFEKWHARKRKARAVNSLAYCAQEVLTAAREMEDPDSQTKSADAQPAFDAQELEAYFRRNAEEVRTARKAASKTLEAVCGKTAESLLLLAEAAARDELGDIETLEQRLTVLEERLTAAARQQLTEEQLFEARQEMERQLAPYRSKMTADQLGLFEKQYLDRKCLETCGLPRLSLFYM